MIFWRQLEAVFQIFNNYYSFLIATLRKFNILLCFAVGGLLGDVFLHLLPEAWAQNNKNDPRKD